MRLSGDAEDRFRLQDYSQRPNIAGVETVELRRFNDDDGSMTELARFTEGALDGFREFKVAQVNFSTLAPGAIKGLHVHRLQTDVWFVPPEEKVLLVLVDVREGSATEGEKLRMVLGDCRSQLVKIPPGVAHGCRNLGEQTARILYFTDRQFSPDPDATDEGRLPWDLVGADIWNLSPD